VTHHTGATAAAGWVAPPKSLWRSVSYLSRPVSFWTSVQYHRL